MSQPATELRQRISDALEDAGLYDPADDIVEGVFFGVVEPLAEALQAVALFEHDGKPSPEAIIARAALADAGRS